MELKFQLLVLRGIALIIDLACDLKAHEFTTGVSKWMIDAEKFAKDKY